MSIYAGLCSIMLQLRIISCATILLFGTLFVMTSSAWAGIVARVDLSSQTMRVSVDGRHYYTWRVSTGRGRYRTPTGSYRPKFLKRRHYSRKYYGSPMPYSIFYRGGYAIHGTNQIRSLGRPASHGCVRLHPSNASRLFRLVKRYGKRNTRIIIQR